MASADLILITGSSGHVGFRALTVALEQGYRVRLALRSEKRLNAIKSALKEHYPHLDASKIEYVEVADLGATGAYDAATQGVTGVVHIASPITTGGDMTTDEFHTYFIEPAVKGTIGMLESAKKSSSVKRVVITSSVVAVMPFPVIAGVTKTDTTYNGDSRIPTDQGPYKFGEFQAYSASKAAAFNETNAWIEREKPQFDVVHVNPSFVEGRDDLHTSAAGSITGTNAVILSLALGEKWDAGKPSSSIHNDDVARAHIEALKPSVPAGTYILSERAEGSEFGSDWSQVPVFVEKLFPEAVKAGTLRPQDAKAITTWVKVDGSKTEEVFGFKFLSLEEQVKSVVGQYLELLKKEGKA